jgi:hypothetical protein
MGLSFDRVEAVYQKDVNNYLTIEAGGKTKAKGAWAKDWRREDVAEDGTKTMVDNLVDFDLVILREAIWEYFQHGTPVEDTINNCKDLRKFQKIVMVSSKYKYSFHGIPNEIKWKENYTWKKKLEETPDCIQMKEKYLRVFATTDETKGGIYKVHAIKNNVNKVADTPLHAIIINDDITKMTTDDVPELDREYYIAEAKRRLTGFLPKKGVA